MEGRGSNFKRYANSKDINNNMSLNRVLLHQLRSPHYNPYYSENLDSLGSGLINYFHTSSGITHCGGDGYTTPVVSPQRSRTMLDTKYSKSGGYRSRGSSSLSPLASLENLDLFSRSRSPLLFSTPSKGDDDVLVMNGISAGSVSGGSMRRTSSSSGSSSSPSSCRSYKSGSQACMAYATNGYCQYGSSCKFSHSPAITPDSTPTTVHTAIPVPFHTAAQVPVHTATPVQVHTAASVPIHLAEPVVGHTPVPVTVEKQNQGQPTFISSHNWSPEDDSIEVTLPSSKATPPTREDVDRYIETVLYGPTAKRRLKVFTGFCPA